MNHHDGSASDSAPGRRPRGRGGSSYGMQDADVVFGAMGLKPGDSFLDAGCGWGEYALHASRIVGGSGVVYALDKNEGLVNKLRREAASLGLANIQTMVADITEGLPFEADCIDVCLLSTVLHIPYVTVRAKVLCAEIRRVLKPDGRLAIIECHKRDMPFGPPKHIRLSSEEVQVLVAPCGFELLNEIDLGDNYMVQFLCSGSG